MRLRRRFTAAIAALLAAACQRGDERSGARAAAGRRSEARGAEGSAGVRSDERPPSAVEELQGTIARASADRVVVTTSGGRPSTLAVRPGTSIELDGAPVTPEQLPEGAQVRVAFEPSGEGGTVIRIEAIAGPGRSRMYGGSNMREGAFGGGTHRPADGAEGR